MKKGFTLAEMLGVITILAIIGLLVFPAIDKSIKEGRENVFKTQVRNIEEGAKQWAIDGNNPTLEDDGDVAKLTLYQLKQAGRIDNNVTNPKTKKPFPDDMIVDITRTASDYETNLIETTGNETSMLEYNGEVPAVKLNGKEIIYLEYQKNSTATYTDAGVTAYAPDGSAISDITSAIKDANDRIILAISYGQIGTYHVYYDVEYNDIIIRVVRTVIVRDSKAPTIILPTTTTRVAKGSAASYDLIGTVSVVDESAYDIVVDRTLPSTEGTYTITYTATDRSKRKNVATARRTIEVY